MLKDPQMSNSASKKLTLVKEIIAEGKIEDASSNLFKYIPITWISNFNLSKT
ncbi:MAG: hypothetical protein ACFE94_19710 [Candidatus Hodarchaeota archaeon]